MWPDVIDLHFPPFTVIAGQRLLFNGRLPRMQRHDSAQLTPFPELERFWLNAGEEWQSCTIDGGVCQFRIGDGPVFSLGGKSRLDFRDRNGRFEGRLMGCDVGYDFEAAYYQDGLWHYRLCAGDGSYGLSKPELELGPAALFDGETLSPFTVAWAMPGPLSRPSGLAERAELLTR
jgi:hypothetical protein